MNFLFYAVSIYLFIKHSGCQGPIMLRFLESHPANTLKIILDHVSLTTMTHLYISTIFDPKIKFFALSLSHFWLWNGERGSVKLERVHRNSNFCSEILFEQSHDWVYWVMNSLYMRKQFHMSYLKGGSQGGSVNMTVSTHQLSPLFLPPLCNIRGACFGNNQRRDYEKIGNDLNSMVLDSEWFDTFFL